MGETILEFLASIIQDSMPSILKSIGARIKWVYYLGKKQIKDIHKEEWNTRIGGIFILIVFLLTIWISNH